jgi:spermidine dehydrogenase
MPDKFNELGMNRRIPRRDFLNGIAVGVVAAAPQAFTAEAGREIYPPLQSRLRGNLPSAIAEFDHIRAGKYAQFPVSDSEINEEYDLVIVGGGISGLAAAHFYRTALGSEQRILILENHDDFGGHAKRNEFQHAGRTYIGYGGTMAIATPYPYSYTAKALINELGIDVSRNSSIRNRELDQYGLHQATFFDQEHFLEDRLVIGNSHQSSFFSKAPLSEAACRDLIRVHGKNPDYLAGLSAAEKIARLRSMSHLEYLRDVANVTPEALPFFYGNGGRNNKRVDTMPALEAARSGAAGFNGLGLKLPEEFNEGSYFLHFPDGNASIARLLVSKLVPQAMPGNPNMDSIVQTRAVYRNLDTPGSNVRIRLGSCVLRLQHNGNPENSGFVKVAYRRQDKDNDKLCGVQARYCILACYNALIPALVPEIPAQQKEALAYPVKVPMMYTNVLLRRWNAWQKLGISSVSAPGMYYHHMALDPGTTVGGYDGVSTPEEPILVHMVRNPNKPGLPRKEQNRAGQQELLSMTFEQHEFKLRDQLSRVLKSGGFDPVEDILAITVNRWPYGYAYTYDTLADPDVPQEERPHVIGRKRFGRISIANSDAGAAAFTNQAIDEANRAVQEILLHQGLT